jgi:quercetin dioxygenase-like cupin family protein
MMGITGAELHRAAAGTVQDWHTAPRRQYVITLSGRGEVEVAGGKKIALGPGHIDLVEDTTGKGHITRTIEDRVTLTLPLSDQSGRSTASR